MDKAKSGIVCELLLDNRTAMLIEHLTAALGNTRSDIVRIAVEILAMSKMGDTWADILTRHLKEENNEL